MPGPERKYRNLGEIIANHVPVAPPMGDRWVAEVRNPFEAPEPVVIVDEWGVDAAPEDREAQMRAEEALARERMRQVLLERDRIAAAKKQNQDILMKLAGTYKATVSQYFGTKLHDGMFGVEVEVEGIGLPQGIKYFEDKRDGSLRGEGREYVFAKPLSLKDSHIALSYFEKAFKGVKVDMSFRTSVHVHVNVARMNKLQLCTFLYLAHLVENALVNYCGPSRVGNRFCLRIIDAVDKTRELEQLFQTKGFRVRGEDAGKYCAINVACLPQLGSVEFRSMRGTINREEIEEWIGILNRVYEKSLTFESPKAVADLFLEVGAEAFAKEVFGEFLPVLRYEGMVEELRTNFSLLITLPYEEIADFV